MEVSKNLEKFKEYMIALNQGPIEDARSVGTLLSRCWDEFDGGDSKGMKGYKLPRRMEKVEWHPPVLIFKIERHGPIMVGSKYAPVDKWEVDIDRLSAKVVDSKKRLIEPLNPRLDVKPIATELTEIIVNRNADPRVKYYEDGTSRVIIGEIIPQNSASKQTVDGRRKSLRKALKESLSAYGWEEIGRWKCSPKH